MRMDYQQQVNFRDKMFKRNLGVFNSETQKLNTESEALEAANEQLRKKMAPYKSFLDQAPGLEEGYPRVPGKYNEMIQRERDELEFLETATANSVGLESVTFETAMAFLGIKGDARNEYKTKLPVKELNGELTVSVKALLLFKESTPS